MEMRANLDKIVTRYRNCESPLLPILNDIQAEFGCVNEDAKKHLANALNLSRAEVHGVVSFYHDFKPETATLPVIKMCRAEACQARGSEVLAAEVSDLAEGKCEIETVYCLGLCSVGPNAMIDNEVHARLDAPALSRLIKNL